MSLFAIGDPHLSFSTDKPMDIFKGWDDYVTKLQKNWNNVVTDDDTVVIPGDISWAMSLESAKKDFEFINNLNGNKIILNHSKKAMRLRRMAFLLSDITWMPKTSYIPQQ